jgi:hypothetical protein
MFNKKAQSEGLAFFLGTLGILFILGLLVGGVYFFHSLSPWWEGKTGESELARAEQNRQIAILEAQAKLDSAEKLAQAEVVRAKGVAQANEIIGDSLKNNDAYLRYLWIQGMQTNDMQVVYVPTEANLPILEATRLE